MKRYIRNTYAGCIGFLALCILLPMLYITPPATAQDPQKGPNQEDFLQFCVDKWGVTKTAECFDAQREAVDLLRDFHDLNLEKVDVAARLCIDKHIYPEYNDVVDVIGVLDCMTEILDAERSTILYKLPRI